MNLTTVAKVKTWCGVTHTTDDTLISQLIGQASRLIFSYTGRTNFALTSFTRTIDGRGGQSIILRDFPIYALSSLIISGQTITAATSTTDSGYILSAWDGYLPGNPQKLSLRDYYFCSGIMNVQMSYQAGYTASETQVIPATPYTVTTTQSQGTWFSDVGVTLNGVAMTPVTGTPTTGQYKLGTNAGDYVFAAADTGKTVIITYSFIPADIEQACIEIVAERYRYKNRIGEISKSLGGQETISFSTRDMTDYVKMLLQGYRMVAV